MHQRIELAPSDQLVVIEVHALAHVLRHVFTLFCPLFGWWGIYWNFFVSCSIARNWSSRCGHDRAHMLQRRRLRQSAATAGTVFEHAKPPLANRFAAMCLVAADKGGVSALRLVKMIGVSSPTAQSMLRELRRAMGDRDRSCWLTGLVEADDALMGGQRAGRRGRGAGAGSRRRSRRSARGNGPASWPPRWLTASTTGRSARSGRS